MKALLFFVSAGAAAIVVGTQIAEYLDPLPPTVIYPVPSRSQHVEPPISAIIEAERQRYNLPAGLLEGVIFTESSFNELARNPEKNLCRKMAAKGWSKTDCESRGLMGIVYGWHKDNCSLTGPHELFVPKTNIRCGAKILKQKVDLAKGDIRRGLGFFNNDKTGKYAARVLRMAKKFARS